VSSRAGRYFGQLYEQISSDIFKLCEALRFVPTNQQVPILEEVQRSVRGRRRMAVKSGQGPGKSTIAVVIALFRVLQAYKSLVVLTAPTQRQCRDSFLARAREIMEVADPVLKRIVNVSASKITIAGVRDWGVKTVTASSEVTAQGIHVPPGSTLTVIGDEAAGIDREILTQYKGTMSNEFALMLLIGNPNLRDCEFFDCFNKNKPDWWTMTINAEETARDYPWLLHPDRNSELEREYGRDSDVYRVRVLGEFPKQDPDCVMNSEDLYECTQKRDKALRAQDLIKAGRERIRRRQLGIDLARMGGDEATIYQVLGNAVIDTWIKTHVEPLSVLRQAISMQESLSWSDAGTVFVPDVSGLGGGAVGLLYEENKQVHEFNAGGSPYDPLQFANVVTEAWFEMRKMVLSRGIYIPDDPRLIQQLSTRRYTTNKKGQLIIWSKEEYMKEGHDSPDRADGVTQGVYPHAVGTGQHTARTKSRTAGARVRSPGAVLP
jgi:phage terminase large subunit